MSLVKRNNGWFEQWGKRSKVHLRVHNGMRTYSQTLWMLSRENREKVDGWGEFEKGERRFGVDTILSANSGNQSSTKKENIQVCDCASETIAVEMKASTRNYGCILLSRFLFEQFLLPKRSLQTKIKNLWCQKIQSCINTWSATTSQDPEATLSPSTSSPYRKRCSLWEHNPQRILAKTTVQKRLRDDCKKRPTKTEITCCWRTGCWCGHKCDCSSGWFKNCDRWSKQNGCSQFKNEILKTTLSE